MILFLLLIVTALSLFFGLKKKRPIFLLIPFASIFIYFIIEVILFPAPIGETIRFIFSLK
ncbi:hypothetical protein [Fredinandcohnia quinoae]|uniref:Uncharacterized protein n=1 Tax=Fredinandcohnia quinoae TaxID=2918902 RepID=A0AAW5DX00_9BACI|nr:hypothetical protein [Fredinandcohnia sp. SECRCQ15]MCH1625171.1 hypothetical protein [Fredinandcohnia sp. SECRCQ15]